MSSSPYRSSKKLTLRRLALGSTSALVVAVGVLAPARADAHFILQSPASWMSQDSLGLPEKLGPCGDEGGGTVTNVITALHPGETVTVTIDEVIFHPGHYRIAVATDRSQLPPEPPVTAGSSPCGSVPVENPPVFPVLADGVFDHTSPFSGPQSIQVTLPANLTCTKCTLQVIEFMSDHPLNNPGGCFYHHCADISIEPGQDLDGGAGGGGTDDAGGSSGNDAGAGTGGGDGGAGPSTGGDGSAGGPSSGGCSVSLAPGAPAASGLFALVGLGALFGRRRRRSNGS